MRAGWRRAAIVVVAWLVAACAGSPATTPPVTVTIQPLTSATALPTETPASAVPSSSPSPTPPTPPSPTPRPSASPNPTIRPTPVSTANNPGVPCPSGIVRATATGPAAPLVYAGPRTQPVIALTIDDGASDSAVLADLAILEREQVNATFFPIGENVVRSPSVWRAVAAAGFPIANHTYDHFNLTCLTYAGIAADLERDDAAVSRIIGEPLLPVVRPPGGDWDQLVLQGARAAGEQAVVIWDTTLGDTGRGDVAQLVANGERARPGSIVLMHANGPLTQQALPILIAHYRALGYRFVTVGQLLGIDGRVPFPLGS